MSEHPPLPVDAVAVQTFVPRILWLRWLVCAALLPTVVFPFGWALLVWMVLRFFARVGDPAAGVRGALAGSLGVEGDTLVVEQYDRAIRIPCADVLEGWLSPQSADQTLVVLRLRRGRRLVARCTDLAGARDLLRDAGVSVEKRLLEVPLGSLASASGQGPIMHLLGPVLLGFVMLAMAGWALAFADGALATAMYLGAYAVFCAVATTAFAHYIAPGRAIVGTNGVRVARLFRQQFVPYVKIEQVDLDAGPVLLWTDEACIALDTRSFVRDAPASRAALAARLRDAIQTFRGERLAEVKLDLFARKGLDVASWREQVRRVSQGGADYRRVVMESEEVARIAEDPLTPASLRVGAVLALSGRALNPALHQRLRVAAGASANPRLRVALDRALDGGLEEADIWRGSTTAPRLSAALRRSRS